MGKKYSLRKRKEEDGEGEIAHQSCPLQEADQSESTWLTSMSPRELFLQESW